MMITKRMAMPPRTILCSMARRLMLCSNLLLRSEHACHYVARQKDTARRVQSQQLAAAAATHQDPNLFLARHSSIAIETLAAPEGRS
jgi:hypothetical protein